MPTCLAPNGPGGRNAAGTRRSEPRPARRCGPCWPTDVRGFVVQGLSRAGDPRTVEIWCDVPLATARRRFEARPPRHPIHGDPLTDDEWERWRRTARPLQVGPTLHVDTTQPVDAQAVIAWIQDPRRRAHTTTA